MSNNIEVAKEACAHLGKGWALDSERSKKRRGAYINGPDGVSVYITVLDYGAKRNHYRISSGANWRNLRGQWLAPHDHKSVQAYSSPEQGSKGVARRIRARLADLAAECAEAKRCTDRDNDYEARRLKIAAALADMPHSEPTHGRDEKGVQIAIHIESDGVIYGHALVSGYGVSLELRGITPEQAIAAVRAVAALAKVREP